MLIMIPHHVFFLQSKRRIPPHTQTYQKHTAHYDNIL